ncbi:MAG TPA: 2,3-bisphosphoglycerate-independent phosphoglycerate mutase [Candidatus Paceibacterota bacterium]
MKKNVVLVVLDGWGIGRHDYTNPLFVAKPKNLSEIKTRYLYGSLQSSGIAVGLPWDEEGNSEVGHLTIGAGKVIYQHFPRITLSIQRGDFFKNPVLLEGFAHAKKNNSAVHLAGLLTEGNVHASLEHLRALIMLAKKNACEKLFFHFFTDGKDSPPKSVKNLLEKVADFIKESGVGAVASLSGRYYALDRDSHWDRTEKTYAALTGKGQIFKNPGERIDEYYRRGLTDEFIEPFMVGSEPHPIQGSDALIFFDFREDSIRQIASSFIVKNFKEFPTGDFKNLYVATMTSYSDRFSAPVAFPNETVDNPLGKILADQGLLQLRIAETEKYAHVTYFFNGYREKPFKNEYRILIPSKNVARHDEFPEMMAKEIGARVTESVAEEQFSFILANFANPDMIAHTGNYDAAIQAIMTVDEEIGKIWKACLEKDAALLITSDHGNIEMMIDPFTGRPETKHDPNLVPFYLVGKGFESHKSEEGGEAAENEAAGILSDVTPTILELLHIPKPTEMTGESLLRLLK